MVDTQPNLSRPDAVFVEVLVMVDSDIVLVISGPNVREHFTTQYEPRPNVRCCQKSMVGWEVPNFWLRRRKEDDGRRYCKLQALEGTYAGMLEIMVLARKMDSSSEI